MNKVPVNYTPNYTKLTKSELIEKIDLLHIQLPKIGTGKNKQVLKRDLISILKKRTNLDQLPEELLMKVAYDLSPSMILEYCKISK